jgi:ribosomal protein S18 acetylase RimI-like enzyme
MNDRETLLQFEQGVIIAERPFDPTLKRSDTKYYDIEGMITADHIELLVAETDGQLVGSGYARIEDSKSYLQHAKHAYLGFMYVLPQLRGKGINQLIIEKLKEWAKEKNITELRLDVYVQNAAAIRAYEKTGFMQHMVEMRMPL